MTQIADVVRQLELLRDQKRALIAKYPDVFAEFDGLSEMISAYARELSELYTQAQNDALESLALGMRSNLPEIPPWVSFRRSVEVEIAPHVDYSEWDVSLLTANLGALKQVPAADLPIGVERRLKFQAAIGIKDRGRTGKAES